MSIYSPQGKAIYLSPNRLDLLHRRRGLSDQQNGCMVCAVQSGKVSWQEFADWLSAREEALELKKRVRFTSPLLHLASLILASAGCTPAQSWTDCLTSSKQSTISQAISDRYQDASLGSATNAGRQVESVQAA